MVIEQIVEDSESMGFLAAMVVSRIRRGLPTALIRVSVLALACFAGLGGVSMADDSGVPSDSRLTEFTKKPSAGGTEETGDAHRRKTPDVVDRRPTRPSRPLTIQQKRIFVLGLGGREKK